MFVCLVQLSSDKKLLELCFIPDGQLKAARVILCLIVIVSLVLPVRYTITAAR